MMAQMVPRADWLARNLSVSSSSSWTALLGSTCAVRNFASVASERQAAAAGGAQTTTLLSAPPGSLLQVSANLSPVSVSHVMGLEQVSVTADAGAWRVAGRPRPDRSNSQVVECAEALRTAAAAAADAPPSPLSVTVPDRWIDMDITSRGGPIRVSKLQEATLRVASGGGAVDLGSVRATDLTIATTSDSR